MIDDGPYDYQALNAADQPNSDSQLFGGPPCLTWVDLVDHSSLPPSRITPGKPLSATRPSVSAEINDPPDPDWRS